MTAASRAHDVHVLNLMYLLAIQKCVNEDIVRASALYGLSATEAEQIKGLSIEAVHALAGSLNECIATLRISPSAMISLASAPPTVQTLLGSVYDRVSGRTKSTHASAAA
jgi:Flagellar transcriptional activator (FlhD)